MIKKFGSLALALILALTISAAPIGSAYSYADSETTNVTEPVEPTDATAPVETLEVNAPKEATEPIRTAGTTYTGTFPTLPTGSEAIAQTAINLAWPYGTAKSVYSYRGGSATPEFKAALDAVFPNRSGWGAKPKVGASCDVFTETCVRYSGYDKSVPRGLTDAFSYYPKHPEKWTKTGISKVKDMQPGDVILWKKSNGTGHACIFVKINGVGYLAEAHYNAEEYGCIDKKASDYTPSKYTYFNIYRANAAFSGSLEKGYKGTNVTHLQNFLNWAGFDCGTADGSFGKKTDAAVRAFQEAAGLKVDGKFGKASLAAAKTYIPTSGPIIHEPPAKKTYSGAFPNVGTKGLKYKKRSAEVKKMQKFLNWYGNYKLKIDGYFGKKTRTAVKSFQKKEKLKVDGVFGKACLKRAKTIKK